MNINWGITNRGRIGAYVNGKCVASIGQTNLAETPIVVNYYIPISICKDDGNTFFKCYESAKKRVVENVREFYDV